MEGIVFLLLIILVSVVVHEVAHGYAAFMLGDPTAHQQGRLTLNPIPHIDLLGTIIIPTLLVLTNTGFLFGWAKPVPYNPYNLRGRFGEVFVAAAGALANIGIAVVFAVLYRLGDTLPFPEGMLSAFATVVMVNIFLAVLNLLPIPPLDGSKVFSGLLPFRQRMWLSEQMARFVNVNSVFFTIAVLLIIVFFLVEYVAWFSYFLVGALLG